jgi:hypothetical protein
MLIYYSNIFVEKYIGSYTIAFLFGKVYWLIYYSIAFLDKLTMLGLLES